MKRTQQGFTLIEIMIVIVVIAILAGIALPAYQGTIRKGNRSDAKAGLMEVAGRMEQNMLDRGSYTYDMTQLGFSTDPRISSEGHYSIDGEACPGGSAATCYVLTATPVSSSQQSKDKLCTSFILDFSGARSATGDDAQGCWH
ncbi:MAG: type IV pilus assembly protein PilE [Bacteroidia bacterium]